MQRYSKKLLIKSFILFYVLIFGGCSAYNKAEEVDPQSVSPLILGIDDAGDRLIVYAANVSVDDIVINGLFRPAGFSYELNFYFDGQPARFDMSKPAVVQMDDTSGARMILKRGSVHGTAIRKSDLRRLFSIKEGTCKEVKVIYRDPLSLPGAYSAPITSNTVKVCF